MELNYTIIYHIILMAQRCLDSKAYAVIPTESKRERHAEKEEENHVVARNTYATIR